MSYVDSPWMSRLSLLGTPSSCPEPAASTAAEEMDVAQRVLGAGWTSDILILGREPRHAWRHRGDGWTPVDLAA